MLIKLIGAMAVILTLTVPILGVPGDASAGFVYVYKKGSIDCTITLASGGKPASDDLVICAVNIKEIGGFCKNPQGKSTTAKGTPYRIQGGVIKGSNRADWIKTRNGNQTQTVSITNEDIQHAVDIWNAEHDPDIDLTADAQCPNGNWTFSGFQVTKADSVITWVKIPTGGTAKYLANTNCRTLTLADGSVEQVCDFDHEPFNYCSRFTDRLGPDNNLADSGLRIYDSSGAVVSLTDGYYRVRECYLHRDVNKDNAYNLAAFGTYDPDIANIVSPQTGNVDGNDDDALGGLILKSPFDFYTGECHQHGEESGGNNYNFRQIGPQRVVFNADGTLAQGDIMCTGGSQLLDGTYP